MNAATEFDLGPLTWVKGEIDLALERADEAIRKCADGADSTQLKFCRTHVHQVHGALAIVGLDGVTQITESLEALLLALEEEKVPAAPEAFAAIATAMAALRRYLDDLMAGEPNQPLRLLPAYQALAAARGIANPHPTDLFYPDLSLRPPKRPAASPRLAPEAEHDLVKAERARFQKGLLTWLKKPEAAAAGLEQMRTAVANIEASQDSPAARSFWWIAHGFLEALAQPEVAAEGEARQLCSRIDAQIRRLLEGSRNVAERMLRDALYYIALAPQAGNGVAAEIRATFELASLLPAAAGQESAAAPHEALLRRLREAIQSSEELWNKFCAGSTAMLAGFAEHARGCASLTTEIGQTDLKRLGQGIGAIAAWLLEQPSRHTEAIAMEMATALLLLQNAQENFKHLGTDFAQQVDLMVARLYACIAGKPADDAGLPLLDEMTRRAQEKLLIGQVAREIQNNLAQIEQTLDAFFRDPGSDHDLAQLEGPIKQVSGALTILGHDNALNALRLCGEQVRRFAQAEYVPQHEDFEAVAQQLSMLGFFVDSLQYGNADFEAFVRKLQGEPRPLPEADEATPEAPPAPSVEAQLEEQKKETQALVEALRERPEDTQLKDELKQNLQTLQKDADLVADRELVDSAKTALSALATGEVASPEFDAVLASLKPPAAEAPAPSAETLQLAQSSHEEIDAELLAIFLEEAHDVLATMAEHFAILEAEPHDQEALTTLRRSTHTLKGSGRMVGLRDLGETAWTIEQTLNLWLRQELRVTPEILEMLRQEMAVFTAWIAHLEDPAAPAPDPAALVALAEGLRGGEAAAPAAPATPAPPAGAQIIELPTARAIRPAPSEVVELAAPETETAEADDFDFDLDDLSASAEGISLSFADDLPAAAEEVAPEAAAEIEFPDLADSPAAPEPIQPAPAPTLYDIFREEARGHLDTLRTSFSELEQDPSAPTSFEMTRAAHTLGGIAATVGILPINKLAIALEHALLRRDGCGRPDSVEGLETVRQAIVGLEDMFTALAEQRSPEPAPAMIEALAEIYPPPAEAEPAAPAQPPEMPQLRDDLDEQLLPIFLEEAQDLVRGFTEQLRAWRNAPADGAPPHALARLLHTFKGSARMAGAMNLGELTHKLEARVEEILHAAAADLPQIEEIEAGCDVLVQMVDRLQSGEPLPEAVPLPPAADAPAIDAPAAVAVAAPAPAAEGEAEPGAQRATLRVRADLLDQLVNEAGELSIARARIEGEMRGLKASLLDLTENVIRLRRQLREIEIQAETQMQAHVTQSHESHADFDPLELDRFTRFQELTRFMAESVNDVATVQQNLLKNLDDANAALLAQARLNRSLQQSLMGVRMVPFASQSERLYRIVRQTAKEVGKRANLDIRGGQVEIDRSVLDKMLAPLEHMLRNAITHGVEGRDERTAQGKPEIGEITLGLQQEGNEIILTMADDGRGLDPRRLRARAETMGLLAPGAAATDAQLFDFIFQPGFSTASEVTQIAGRGIGMDVVKTEVASLGGRIEILSTPDHGTTFRLYLPLTLAVTQTLLVRVGSENYAIPSTMIEQVQELKEKALHALQEKGEAEWMGNRYPLHFLPHLLGNRNALPETRRQYWVLLLRSGAQRVAVRVDELLGNQEVVVKNIGPQLARVVGIAGATVLGDGQVLLILNPVALAGRAQQLPAPAAAGSPAIAPVPTATLPTVLVVDDSLTVRKITSRLLVREGYQVITAKDGVEALEQLLEIMPDVVLSDIEMPRMDGFDLVRNIRGDDRLKSLPVIMITSRTADKHRNYALEIGADHYLGKPYDETELLGLIAGYIRAKGSA